MTIICSDPPPSPSPFGVEGTFGFWQPLPYSIVTLLRERSYARSLVACILFAFARCLPFSAIFQLISSCKYFLFFWVVFAYVYTIRWVIRERQVHRKRARLMSCFDCDCNGWLIATALDKKLARWNMPESVFLRFWCRYVEKHSVLISVWSLNLKDFFLF